MMNLFKRAKTKAPISQLPKASDVSKQDIAKSVTEYRNRDLDIHDILSRATPHNVACGGWRKIWPANALLFLEIHQVFLRKSAFLRIQIFSPSALVELCGIALAIIPATWLETLFNIV